MSKVAIRRIKLGTALFVSALLFLSSVCMAEGGAVKPILIKSLKIKDAKIKLPIDETLTLNVDIKPDNATNKELEWLSSDENVCQVDENGTVRAVGEGKCDIQCVTKDGSNRKAKVTVDAFVPGPPILFRNIPWGSNIETAIEKGDYTNQYQYFEATIPYEKSHTNRIIYTLSESEDCQTGFFVMTDEGQIAGHELSYAVLVFAYGRDENNQITMDTDKGQFLQGKYVFFSKPDNAGNREAVKDLTNKLTGLYGKPSSSGKTVKEGKGYSASSFKETTWTDDFGNKVILSYTDYGFEINYIWNKADNVLKTVYETMKVEKVDNSNNTTGL